jgi:hypothetical protein
VIRRVRRLVPAARGVELSAHDYDRPGKPDCAWNDPQATKALVSGLVNDALAVLAAVADLELDAEQDEAVALLALVAGQDVEPDQRPGTWRIARRVAADRVISTVDPAARHTRKTSARKRDGDKAHIAAEPDAQCQTPVAQVVQRDRLPCDLLDAPPQERSDHRPDTKAVRLESDGAECHPRRGPRADPRSDPTGTGRPNLGTQQP